MKILVVNELDKREYFESLGYYDILAIYEKAIADKEKEDKKLDTQLKRLTKFKDTSGDDIDIEINK